MMLSRRYLRRTAPRWRPPPSPLTGARAQAAEIPIGIAVSHSPERVRRSASTPSHAIDTALDVINNAASRTSSFLSPRDAGLPGLGGAKLKVIAYADHQSDPQKGRAEAERLITQDKVPALIGSYQSAVAATISQTAERYARCPYMAADNSSPSAARAAGSSYIFRPGAHDEMFSTAMFDFLDSS